LVGQYNEFPSLNLKSRERVGCPGDKFHLVWIREIILLDNQGAITVKDEDFFLEHPIHDLIISANS
jgi:hypothetical protein